MSKTLSEVKVKIARNAIFSFLVYQTEPVEVMEKRVAEWEAERAETMAKIEASEELKQVYDLLKGADAYYRDQLIDTPSAWYGINFWNTPAVEAYGYTRAKKPTGNCIEINYDREVNIGKPGTIAISYFGTVLNLEGYYSAIGWARREDAYKKYLGKEHVDPYYIHLYEGQKTYCESFEGITTDGVLYDNPFGRNSGQGPRNVLAGFPKDFYVGALHDFESSELFKVLELTPEEISGIIYNQRVNSLCREAMEEWRDSVLTKMSEATDESAE